MIKPSPWLWRWSLPAWRLNKKPFMIPIRTWAVVLAVGMPSFAAVPADTSTGNRPAAETRSDGASSGLPYVNESLRGRVVWMSDALKRHFGIRLVREAQQRMLALETTDGRVLPIVEDLRGRSFRKDSRLREMDVQLLVRRYKNAGLIQIIRVYEVQDDGNYVVDYWCDICAIPMFESGPCACCQDQNRLRKRHVREVNGL